ncbi:MULTISPECIES: PLP-dependent aminotransferase family protein [Sphingobacterium]|uniref:MocR-like pyridoxine biosynthesis transcription factor PdxR n=1 Tax=Sphingobacterium TaxID=28453 RepID=UPI00038A41E0|nr:PLP-dependent aminotransferase family protein [Sphingobacterium sp. IITKGP-BTPF85]KKX49423.1 GntR family transcriptional regulator [Sphingobacterium sp. IITKGP-BTPF85]
MLPFEHIITIDKSSNIALYRQISISIINAISDGVLKPGAHLPSSRELAKNLAVHRKTVIAAYEELQSQDWIIVEPRKYVAVSNFIPILKAQKWNRPFVRTGYGKDLPISYKKSQPEVSVEITERFDKVLIDDGYPDIRLSPIDDLLKTYRTFTNRKTISKIANIGTGQGVLKLREQLANHLIESRGLTMGVEHVLITHGAQMSIYLAAQLLMDNSSHVLVGEPNYPLANQVFKDTGASVISVSVDDDGIDTDAVEAWCKLKKISLIYVIPHHHYPTTVTLSVERRMKLLALAEQYGFVIIEDDYDYDYHYTSSPYLPLASSNHQGHVIYIGSFSKILDPSIRIGFMVAPEKFIAQCTAYRKIIDVGGDGYMQHALAELIKEGELNRYLKKARRCYKIRRDYLDQLLRDRLGNYIYFSLPAGGMAIWVRLKPPFLVNDLLLNCSLEIVRIDETQNAFRFGFASLSENELDQAVSELVKAFKKMA